MQECAQAGRHPVQLGVAAQVDSSLLDRVATPHDVAAAIAWLLDPACLMTGQLMVVDAGFLLGKPPAATGANQATGEKST